MPWCQHCAKVCATVRDTDNGYICCSGCGRVIDQDVYSTEVNFVKGSGGESQMSGSFVRSVQSDYSASRERTLYKGREEIETIVLSLCISGGDSIINPAHAFYRLAVERNFTKGRRTPHVAASCLYIACRQESKPYLLIDFSEYLQVNVYVLGAVFLQLCQLLRLDQHPIVQKPIDPSLFIDRFTERLLGQRNLPVSRTALRIVASMKRDWMQTGRKPSGLCGAALYIATLSHGLEYSKADIVTVVHVCEATLTKRLIEFESTDSGSLTVEEFLAKADEAGTMDHSMGNPHFVTRPDDKQELLCSHVGAAYFACGLCKDCFNDFLEISGGLEGGSDPPAFQNAERKRMMEASRKESNESNCTLSPQCIPSVKHVESSKSLDGGNSMEGESGNLGSDKEHVRDDDDFSDIDDVEVIEYLHTEEEKYFKKIIWEELNKEFLQEQAAKEAVAAAAREAYEAAFKDCSDDVRAAQELAAAAAANVAKSRKERQRKRAEEARNAGPAKTASEATRRMLTRKKLSSKVNLDVLDNIFEDNDAENAKRQKVDSDQHSDLDEQLPEMEGLNEYQTGGVELEYDEGADCSRGDEVHGMVDDYEYEGAEAGYEYDGYDVGY